MTGDDVPDGEPFPSPDPAAAPAWIRVTAPLLCLVATRDQIIPPAHAKKLYDAWGGPKQWVALEDAGHNTTDSHPFFWQNIERFLQERIQ